MATDIAAAAETGHRKGRGVRSKEARSVALDLLDAPRELRRTYLHSLTVHEQAFMFDEVERETGTRYKIWHDDPLGFVQDVLGETMWGLQAEIMESIADPNVNRIVVPAGFGLGKTYLAGRMVAWAGAVNAIGTMRIVTTATRMRQVKEQLWPEIKTAVSKGGLPGRTDTIQWVAPDVYGNDVRVAYGFSPKANDEAAMQGIHGIPGLLLVVDEAGGIAPLIGKGTNNLLTGDAKMLAIGNPPMDDPGSWFEALTAKGQDNEEVSTRAIHIAALDSPAITGEPTPVCTGCVPNMDGHTISEGVNGKSHLPDWAWLNDTLRDYGVVLPEDDKFNLELIRQEIRLSGQPYLIAKVLAEFPKDAGAQILPASWVEAAGLVEDPAGDDVVRLCDLGLADETTKWAVKRGAWVRLGVDIASDGGDEFAIYRAIGDMVHKVHTSTGSANSDSVKVAEVVLEHIDQAQRLAEALGSKQAVRVKVDKNGLGWGVVGDLERWHKTGRHKAQIVGVMVSESPRMDDPAAVMRPYRKRDEMWLAARFLLQPDPSTGFGRIRLKLDHKAMVQLSLPRYDNNASGFVIIESKKRMKARGVSSPDRAEAALLSMYEPEPLVSKKRYGLLN